MFCAFGTERNDYYENQKIIGIGNGICDGGRMASCGSTGGDGSSDKG